jgi:hypothetical protein
MNSRPLHPSTARLEPGTTRGRRATPRSAQLFACALAATLVTFGLADPGIGQSDPAKAKVEAGKGKTDVVKEAKVEPSLEGSWSGGGEVAFSATGSRERARCRAHYNRRTKDSYAMQAICATASGKAAQTATVHRVGENRYRGTFHNSEYDITGTIFVVVNGNSQSVRLTSSSGSALFRLSR